MTKSTVEKRLTEIENRVAHLSGGALIGGIIAKAHSGVPYDPLTDDGESVNRDTRRLNQCVSRLDKLEPRFDDLYNHVTGAKPAQDDEAALGTLAKAQSAVQRKSSPAGLLARAQAVIDDPTEFGIVEAHVQAGQFRKAAEMLEAHEKRATHADEDAAQQQVESQIDTYDQMATISELGEKMAAFEETMTGLLSRLARLERPQTAPVQEAVVAKGYGGKRQRQETDYRDSVAGLAERAQGVVDSSSLIGQLNSMLQSGDSAQIKQARQTIEQAEVRHESRMKSRDRRAL